MRLAVELHGANELVRALDDWQGQVKNLRPAFRDLTIDVLAPAIARRFEAHGPGWAPLSPNYAAWKALHFPGKGLLERTGAMRATFTDRSRFGSSATTVTESSLTIDPKSTPYWKYHQQGTPRMPARPILAFDADTQTQIGSYLERWLTARAREYGLERGRFS